MTDRTRAQKRLSLALWIGGGLLWLIVGVLFLASNFREPPQARASAESDNESASEPTELAGKELPPPPEAPEGGGLVEPASAWDSEGIGEFTLTERSGESVTNKDLLGKPWIVGFIFTRCAGPCPRVSGQMAQLQEQLEDQKIRLVTMTVDPDYDTPKILRRYAEAFGAKDDWLFLTGDKQKMYRYIEKHFKMPVEEMTGEDRKPGFQVLHTTNLLLIDSEGVVQGAYNALKPAEIAKLKKEARDLAEDRSNSDDQS